MAAPKASDDIPDQLTVLLMKKSECIINKFKKWATEIVLHGDQAPYIKLSPSIIPLPSNVNWNKNIYCKEATLHDIIMDLWLKYEQEIENSDIGLNTCSVCPIIYDLVSEISKSLKEKKNECHVFDDIKHRMKQMLENKMTDTLKQEVQNDRCCSIYRPTDFYPTSYCSISNGTYGSYIYMDKIDELKAYCEPFKRIETVLDAYHKFINKSLWNKMKLSDIIQVEGKYEHQQLLDDFFHIKIIHIDADNDKIRSHDREEDKYKDIFDNIAAKICKYFQRKFHCDFKKCHGFLRHYKLETNDQKEQKVETQEEEEEYIEDSSFEQQCDSIHSYFLHSTIKFGIRPNQVTVADQAMMDEYNPYLKKRMYSRRIVSTPTFEQDDNKDNDEDVSQQKTAKSKENGDDLWWNKVTDDDEEQSENEIYRILVENTGVFRWQHPHGFVVGQNQEISHYKPKWGNIKQEALQNRYEPLSKDNWNQTVRKSTIFFKSWARQRIRTKDKSFFDDQVTGQKQLWVKGVEISMQEIVTLKLYTDFDKLQFELKKSFRFETIDDIFVQNDAFIPLPKKGTARKELKDRLETFYHWRGQLLIVLNKFGTKFNNENNMVLYHGVNAKMIMKPTQTFAFNGPLSTSSSYHVARTFSAAKGMVLKITSHYPRLNYCNAFDASLISDYPEEQEWLIGFMYVRILEIRTRKLNLIDKADSFSDLIKTVSLSSLTREEFFAMHLFNQQIFSMSDNLERIIAQFLKVNRKECCDPHQTAKYQHQHIEFKDWNMDCMCKDICSQYHGNTSADDEKEYNKDQTHDPDKEEQDEKRNRKVFPILCKKFTEFREAERIKFDTISNHLKRFFMEEIEEKDIDTNKKKWVMSFDEITTVYPKIKEILFINQYKFDNVILKNLIKQIERKDKKNTIEKIVFLYFNYKNADDNGQPSNDTIFENPNNLDIELRNKLEKESKWKIKYNQIGKTGYKIKIRDGNKNV